MKLQSEKLTIEPGGEIVTGAAATVDHKLATAGYYPPQSATLDLPTASGVEGMIIYDTDEQKLVVSNGAAYETITSAVPE